MLSSYVTLGSTLPSSSELEVTPDPLRRCLPRAHHLLARAFAHRPPILPSPLTPVGKQTAGLHRPRLPRLSRLHALPHLPHQQPRERGRHWQRARVSRAKKRRADDAGRGEARVGDRRPSAVGGEEGRDGEAVLLWRRYAEEAQGVPLDEERRVHANKTRGIAYLRVLASRGAFEEKAKEVEAIVGIPPLSDTATTGTGLERTWELEAPIEEGQTVASRGARLILAAADENDEEELKFVKENGTGVFEVGFTVEAGGGSEKVRTPYGRVAWVAR